MANDHLLLDADDTCARTYDAQRGQFDISALDDSFIGTFFHDP